mgnify:CR=1 FL=1
MGLYCRFAAPVGAELFLLSPNFKSMRITFSIFAIAFIVFSLNEKSSDKQTGTYQYHFNYYRQTMYNLPERPGFYEYGDPIEDPSWIKIYSECGRDVSIELNNPVLSFHLAIEHVDKEPGYRYYKVEESEEEIFSISISDGEASILYRGIHLSFFNQLVER